MRLCCNLEPWIVERIVLLHLTDAEGLVTKKCIKPASASHGVGLPTLAYNALVSVSNSYVGIGQARATAGWLTDGFSSWKVIL